MAGGGYTQVFGTPPPRSGQGAPKWGARYLAHPPSIPSLGPQADETLNRVLILA